MVLIYSPTSYLTNSCHSIQVWNQNKNKTPIVVGIQYQHCWQFDTITIERRAIYSAFNEIWNRRTGSGFPNSDRTQVMPWLFIVCYLLFASIQRRIINFTSLEKRVLIISCKRGMARLESVDGINSPRELLKFVPARQLCRWNVRANGDIIDQLEILRK